MRRLILNVDDFEPQRHSRTRTLQGAGFEVIEAATGSQALALARERHPALVLLDVQLPDVDGREVCRQIKNTPATADILVLHVSAAFRDAASRTEALANGADAYLVEAVEPDELVAHVNALLRLAAAESRARRSQSDAEQTERKLRISEERLRLAQQAGAVGIFDWNLSTGEIAWTPELEDLFGIPAPADPCKGQEAWLKALHPDDREAVTDEMREWLESSSCELVRDYRIVLPDGRERWLAARSRVFRDADGRPLRVVGTNIDVTERRELLRRLEAQRAQLEAVYQAMADGVTLFDAEGRILLVNDVVARHAGCGSLEEMRGLLQSGLPFELEELDGTRLPNERWPVRRVLRGETIRDWELRARRTDTGQEWIFSYSGRPILEGQQKPTLALVVSRDVTLQKRAEAALRESEEAARRRAEELEALMELVPAAIWVAHDSECRVITGNRAANRFYEAQDGENVSAGPARGGEHDATRLFFQGGKALPPEQLPMQQAAAAGHEVRDAEVEVVLPSGRQITILGSAAPLFDERGGVRGGIAAFVDITERKRMEAAVQQARDVAEAQRAEIASLYDSAPIGLCVLDREGRYRVVNRRLAEMNGVAPELHVGRTVREVVPAVADRAEFLLHHVFETGQPLMGIELLGETPSEPGVRRAWSQNWFPVKGPDGEVIAVNVGVEEITRNKQIEEDLRQANRLKDEFLATLSHELRTPLTAILGWSQLLQRADIPPEMLQQGLAAIFRNAETQRTIVNDVLDVSRIISGKMRLQLEELDLLAVVADAVESMKPALAAKQLHLDLSELAAPATVTGDPDRLRQVIWNLLSNAVKFTRDGGRIGLSVVRAEHTLDLQVSDNGIGIQPDFLPYVFDRFSQADRSTSRRHAGLGLGLAIVRHLVELHGGEVFAASEGEGKGTTFTVRLPIRAVRQAVPPAPWAGAEADRGTAAAPGPVPSPAALRGKRVLVLDDLEDARSLIAAVLESAGARAVLAAYAEEALELLAAAPADVVLADIGLPGMDGFEFVRRLRATGSRVPVIALTAYGGAFDRAKALAAGFDQHMAKPVLPDELLAGLAEVLQRTS